MPEGVTGRLYVSGSCLWWEDADITIDQRRKPAPQPYKFVGALPRSIDGDVFAGQPPGRIWVSGEYLHYSDTAGTTRFLYGEKRNETTQSPPGRVYVNRRLKAQTWEPQQPGTDLWWVGISGSKNVWYSVRDETSLIPADIVLNMTNYGDKGMVVSLYNPDNLALLKPSNFDIRIIGSGMLWYSSSNCTGTPEIDAYEQRLDVLIPKGTTAVYVCPDNFNGGDGKSYYYFPSQSNGCPAVNIINSYPAKSWKVLPYIAGHTGDGGGMLLGAYTSSTFSALEYKATTASIYYTSSQSTTTEGTFHRQAYSSSVLAPITSNTIEFTPISLGIDRVTISYEGTICTDAGGSGGCNPGSGSCGGNCYALASEGCCGTTIYNLSVNACCGTTIYDPFDTTKLCCGGSLFTKGPGFYSICCGGANACAWVLGPDFDECVDGVCVNGSQP